jgi:hypothetical protein
MPFRPVAICMLMVLAGCGGGRPPQPIQGPAKEVADVIDRLQKALAHGQFQAVCDSILSSSARRQAGGAACPRILRRAAGDLRRPRILVDTIQLGQDRALVKVRTTAAGQAVARDVIRLVRERGQYRIASLGGP